MGMARSLPAQHPAAWRRVVRARARVPETPIFEEIKRRGAISRNPFVEAIFTNPRSFLVAVGLKLSEVSWFYILTIFIVVYATGQLDLPRTLLLNAISIAAVVEVITIPLFGWASDHIGRRIFYYLGVLPTVLFRLPDVLAPGHQGPTDHRPDHGCGSELRPWDDVRTGVGVFS